MPLWIQLFPELPRIHHVKGFRQSLNNDIEVIDLPSPYVGKYMPVKSTMTKALLNAVSLKSNVVLSQAHTALLYTAGKHEGTTYFTHYCQAVWRWSCHCSRSNHGVSHLLFPRCLRKCPFSCRWRLFPCLKSCLHLGNHTYASVRGPEAYEFLKASFEPVWKELGELIADPTVHIKDHDYRLNIVFGSDYKVHTHTCKYTLHMKFNTNCNTPSSTVPSNYGWAE